MADEDPEPSPAGDFRGRRRPHRRSGQALSEGYGQHFPPDPRGRDHPGQADREGPEDHPQSPDPDESVDGRAGGFRNRIKVDPDYLPELSDCGKDLEEDKLEAHRKALLATFKKLRERQARLRRIPARKKTMFRRGRVVNEQIELIADLSVWPPRLEEIIDRVRTAFQDYNELAEKKEEWAQSFRRTRDADRRTDLRRRPPTPTRGSGKPRKRPGELRRVPARSCARSAWASS